VTIVAATAAALALTAWLVSDGDDGGPEGADPSRLSVQPERGDPATRAARRWSGGTRPAVPPPRFLGRASPPERPVAPPVPPPTPVPPAPAPALPPPAAPEMPPALARELSRFTDAQLQAELESLRLSFPEVEVIQATCPQPGCRAEVISTHAESLVGFGKAVDRRFQGFVKTEIKGLGPEAGPERAGKIWLRFAIGSHPAAAPGVPSTPPIAPAVPN
jgi:hypothetical protein